MPRRAATLYGRSLVTTGRGGVWAQARRVPRDQNWWRFNATAFAGFVRFLNQRYPNGAGSAHMSWNGGSWIIWRDGSGVDFDRGRANGRPATSDRPHQVTGRMVRRHGISEAFMNYLADRGADDQTLADETYKAPGRAWQRGGVKLDVVTECRHGHSLVDLKNVYTVSRIRRGVEEVERRCRACNRDRVAQHRARVSGNRRGTYHEAGTLWVGDAPITSVTTPVGRFHHIANAYACDQSLFPTVDSVNPVLTGLTLARQLAEQV